MLDQLLANPQLFAMVAFCLGQLAGMVGNWVVKWMRGQVAAPWHMATTELRYTIGSAVLQFLTALGTLGTGIIDGAPAPHAFGLGIVAGGVLDAVSNRGTPPAGPGSQP